MSTFVLVHGSFHGGWCWEKVAPLLEAAGHRVEALDLPGHGADRTPIADLSLEAYVRRVCQTLDEAAEPVVLVGHSMAGVVITEVAEERPERIQTLVYLAAYLPRDGESLLQLAQQDTQSLLMTNLIIREDRGDHVIKDDALRAVFYADCTDADANMAIRRLVPEPLAPVTTPVTTSAERYGRVPRVYITAVRDRALGPLLQQQMYAASPCRQVLAIDTGHSPFLAAPAVLAELLLAIAQDAPAPGCPRRAQALQSSYDRHGKARMPPLLTFGRARAWFAA